MKCPACGNKKGFKYEGEQRLPKKKPDGTVVWVTYELLTCPKCGSTMCGKENGNTLRRGVPIFFHFGGI